MDTIKLIFLLIFLISSFYLLYLSLEKYSEIDEKDYLKKRSGVRRLIISIFLILIITFEIIELVNKIFD